MNKILKKGTIGYLRRYRLMTLAKIVFFLLLILLQLLGSRLSVGQSFEKIFLVTAIITVLPMANLASPFFASLSTASTKRQVFDGLSFFQGRGILLYEILITNREGLFPLDGVFICRRHLYILARFDKKREAGVKAYLEEALGHVCSGCGIRFFYGLREMEETLKKMFPSKALPDASASDSKEPSGEDLTIKELLLALSI